MLTPGRIVAPAPIHTFSATSMGPPVNYTCRSRTMRQAFPSGSDRLSYSASVSMQSSQLVYLKAGSAGKHFSRRVDFLSPVIVHAGHVDATRPRAGAHSLRSPICCDASRPYPTTPKT